MLTSCVANFCCCSEREGLESIVSRQGQMIATADEFRKWFTEKHQFNELQRRFRMLTEESEKNSENHEKEKAALLDQLEQAKQSWRSEVEELMTQVVEVRQEKNKAIERVNELETVSTCFGGRLTS